MLKILVIGGSGSVGQNFVETMGDDIPIFVIDRVLGTYQSINCNYWVCELIDSSSLDSITSDLPNDLITVYLAGHLINFLQKEDFIKSIEDNVTALANFIFSMHPKLKHLVLVSSVSVYGVPKYNPIDEKHPIDPFSSYGVMKACAEFVAKSICAQLKIPLTIVRCSQLFGLSSAEKSLPHLLVKNLKMGKKMKIFCDPNFERDYLHVSDLSSFLFNVVKSPLEGVFNIGFGRGIKIFDLFQMSYDAFRIPFDLEKALNSQLTPSFSQVMNIQRANQAYGFKPKYNLGEWFRKCAEHP